MKSVSLLILFTQNWNKGVLVTQHHKLNPLDTAYSEKTQAKQKRLQTKRFYILEVEKELYEIIHVSPVMSEPDFFYQLEKFYQSESTHWIRLGFVNKAQETSINHTTSVKRFTI